jgi:hypothetical protein
MCCIQLLLRLTKLLLWVQILSTVYRNCEKWLQVLASLPFYKSEALGRIRNQLFQSVTFHYQNRLEFSFTFQLQSVSCSKCQVQCSPVPHENSSRNRIPRDKSYRKAVSHASPYKNTASWANPIGIRFHMANSVGPQINVRPSSGIPNYRAICLCILLSVSLCCSVYCSCVNVYCTAATGISGQFSTTLTDGFPCFFLSCKVNAMV